mgnify:CR=1 FL=1
MDLLFSSLSSSGLMKSPASLHVTLLGPDIDHRRSLEAMLAGRVAAVDWVPDSHTFLQGRPFGVVSRLSRASDQVWGTCDSVYLDRVLSVIDKGHADVVVCYWGTTPLADLRAIKRQRPHLKMVLMVLCYPVALQSFGVIRQRWMMRRAAACLDGVLYPNQVMADYFEREVWSQSRRPRLTTVVPPCWPQSYQPTAQQAPKSKEPNIIFAGRTDLSHHTVHAADDLRPLMVDILGAGIHLHHVRSRETDDGHPFRHPFEPMSQLDLIRQMSSYDASLIAYNTQACARPERFALTVPDRLITSVAAGVPVAIPSDGYEGAKSYLAHYPAVFEFDSASHLAALLQDRSRVESFRQAAWQAREHYSAEYHGDQLADFLCQCA